MPPEFSLRENTDVKGGDLSRQVVQFDFNYENKTNRLDQIGGGKLCPGRKPGVSEAARETSLISTQTLQHNSA